MQCGRVRFSVYLASTLLWVSLLVGCGTEDIRYQPPATPPTQSQPETASPVAEAPAETKVYLALNPLTGLEVPAAALKRRPLAIMVENSPAARPQTGLGQADIVYEMLAEGAITRFMGIYYSQDADIVGPVRSARPYFIERALEYAAIYTHCGGSPEAKVDLRQWRVADLDEFANAKAFYRSKDRKAPHNLYTDTTVLWPYALKKPGFDQAPQVPEFSFLAAGEKNPGGHTGQQLTIHYPRSYSVVDYEYQPSDGTYLRSQGGKPHVDKQTGAQLAAKNILIQYVHTKVIDSAGRRKMQMVGAGQGLFFTGGEVYDIKWKKASLRAVTEFTLTDGAPLKLSPGQTWIQVVPDATKVDYK